MSAFSATPDGSGRPLRLLGQLRSIANVRAGLALGWAVALIIAVGGAAPSTASGLSLAVAALLASYPLIDVVASLAGAGYEGSAQRVLRVNAAVGTVAVIVIAAAAFGADAGATLASFGAWAVVSGLVQLGVAVHARRSRGGQLPMIVSAGLSTIAGLGFIAQSGGHTTHPTYIGGYMALGALLYLLWARRERAHPRPARGN